MSENGTQINRPRPMTQEELQADADREELAAKQAQEEAAKAKVETTPEPTPAPTPEAPKKEESAAPTPEDAGAVDKLKAEMAEKDARIAELTKRLRDEDGKRGGELTTLRGQVERLGDQLREIMEENRALRQKPPEPTPPPTPDALEADYPAVSDGINSRIRPVSEEARKAKLTAEEARQLALQIREDRFFESVRSQVPKLDEYNSNEGFLKWCEGRNPGTRFTRQEILDDARSHFDPRPAIELLQQWENENTKPVSAPPVETPKVPKPSKEAQVELPKSPGPSSPQQPPGPKRSRMKELEDKIFKWGTSTVEDRKEYDALCDAEALGKLT